MLSREDEVSSTPPQAPVRSWWGPYS